MNKLLWERKVERIYLNIVVREDYFKKLLIKLRFEVWEEENRVSKEFFM